jgi:hypothetical protein
MFTLLGRGGGRVRHVILWWTRCSSWWSVTCADLAADGLRDEQESESDMYTEDELLFVAVRVIFCRHARCAPAAPARRGRKSNRKGAMEPRGRHAVRLVPRRHCSTQQKSEPKGAEVVRADVHAHTLVWHDRSAFSRC